MKDALTISIILLLLFVLFGRKGEAIESTIRYPEFDQPEIPEVALWGFPLSYWILKAEEYGYFKALTPADIVAMKNGFAPGVPA